MSYIIVVAYIKLIVIFYWEKFMLNITRKVEYALIALRHMQSKKDIGLTSAKEIAAKYGIPKQLLAKILQKMSREGIVKAVHGPTGGYKIAANL